MLDIVEIVVRVNAEVPDNRNYKNIGESQVRFSISVVDGVPLDLGNIIQQAVTVAIVDMHKRTEENKEEE
jgi:hypothetical protein